MASYNQLTGTVPWYGFQQLQSLLLGQNLFTDFPSVYGGAPFLASISLADNRLKTMPDDLSFAAMPSLTNIDFSNNPELGGPSSFQTERDPMGSLLPPRLESLRLEGPQPPSLMPFVDSSFLPHLPKTLRYCELGLLQLPYLQVAPVKKSGFLSNLSELLWPSKDTSDPNSVYADMICRVMPQFPPGCTCSIRFDSVAVGPHFFSRPDILSLIKTSSRGMLKEALGYGASF